MYVNSGVIDYLRRRAGNGEVALREHYQSEIIRSSCAASLARLLCNAISTANKAIAP